MPFEIPNWLTMQVEGEDDVIIRLKHYHAVNLLEVLRAAEIPGPLVAISTGDWCGELRNALESLQLDRLPNRPAKEIAEHAKAWLTA
jgi:hypothetical protein